MNKQRRKKINKQREGGREGKELYMQLLCQKKRKKEKKIRVIISMYVLNTWHEIVRGCSSEGRTTALN